MYVYMYINNVSHDRRPTTLLVRLKRVFETDVSVVEKSWYVQTQSAAATPVFDARGRYSQNQGCLSRKTGKFPHNKLEVS